MFIPNGQRKLGRNTQRLISPVEYMTHIAHLDGFIEFDKILMR